MYASAQGGAWLSDVDPTSSSPDGVTVPLNDIARGQSGPGEDAPPGSPVYRGVTDADAEVRQAITCAQAGG